MNEAAQARQRTARYLHRCLKDLRLPLRQVYAELPVDRESIRNLHRSAPHVGTLARIARYIEQKQRERNRLDQQLSRKLAAATRSA